MLSEQARQQRARTLTKSKSSIFSSKPKFYSLKRGQTSEAASSSLTLNTSVTNVSNSDSDANTTLAETETNAGDTVLDLNDVESTIDNSVSRIDKGESYVKSNNGEEQDDVEGETESLVKFLSQVECGFPLLLDRVKQNMNSCKETITFLKKRAAIEEEYAKSMTKLAQSVNEYIEKGDGKQGTFIESLRQTSKVHELIANNRLKFSQFVSEVADDLNTAFKDTERSRKQLKEAGEKHEKHLSQSEAALEKARMKYESSSDNWDKAIQMKENGGHINHGGKGMPRSMSSTIGIFQQSKKPEKLIKEEESARYKAAQANEGYKNQLTQTNQVRAEFHNVHLPRILKSLKETNDECDAALQYHLSKYSYLYEQALMSDATTISPLNSTERGLRSIIEQIDNKADLKEFVTGYVAKNTDITLAEIKEDQYGMPVVPSNKVINPTFGTNLAELLDRENSDVPSFLRNCFGLVEEFCSDAIGVYRASPPGSVLQKVKTAIDKDPSYNLRSEDVLADPSCVTGLIKIFFRELPDPLFTKIMYREFMSAARMDDERMRLLTIHDLVNKLPDPSYATLRLLMNHLDRVGQRQHRNKITVHGLSIIFGPILLSAPDGIDTTNDLYYQCKVVEIILTNFRIIFDTDE